jgi:cobalamin biosynthesis protein CobD/CbiB
VDGHLQRQALTAAERAIEALGRGDAAGARMAVAAAVERDQVGLFAALADAVHLAAAELERDGEISAAAWDHVADAVGPGPLQGLVEQARG